MTNNSNPWIENTGTVPDGVGPDTVIEVEYRDSAVTLWENGTIPNNNFMLWFFDDWGSDVIRWRFV